MVISLYRIVKIVFNVYYFLLVARIVLSWVRIGDNPVTRFIYETTEPVLRLFRRILPPRPNFPLDFSPILAFIVLQLLETLLLRLILKM